ncbi:MAG: hypothetical protein JWM80_4705 [Cyanobacteria bacterium RYN_339]|nr:hypothetical protein [Cyanobacteria bacterium RYN_339]
MDYRLGQDPKPPERDSVEFESAMPPLDNDDLEFIEDERYDEDLVDEI